MTYSQQVEGHCTKSPCVQINEQVPTWGRREPKPKGHSPIPRALANGVWGCGHRSCSSGLSACVWHGKAADRLRIATACSASPTAPNMQQLRWGSTNQEATCPCGTQRRHSCHNMQQQRPGLSAAPTRRPAGLLCSPQHPTNSIPSKHSCNSPVQPDETT